MKILFVCIGNTCRSPMAAALVQHRLSAGAVIDNAGIAPHGQRATPEAVAVVRDRIGVDISQHRPHGFRDDEIGQYDYIVAMDLKVAEMLRREYRVPEARLLIWSIPDPYVRGRAAYERCADEIEKHIDGLAEILKQQPEQASAAAEPPSLPATDLLGLRDRLGKNLEAWTNELASPHLDRAVLHGIAKNALDSFEELFRRSIVSYRVSLSEDEASRGNSLDGFTFGELIAYAAEHNAAFTAASRETPRGAKLFRKRRVLSQAFGKALQKVRSTRDRIHQRLSEPAGDLESLRTDCQEVLTLISAALADPYFDYVCL